MSNIISSSGTLTQYKAQINTDLDISGRILSISSSAIPILTASQYVTSSINLSQFTSSYLNKIIDTGFSEFVYYPVELTSDGYLLVTKSEYQQIETELRYLSSSVPYFQSIDNTELTALEYRNIALKNTVVTINNSTIKALEYLMSSKYYNNIQLIDLLNNLKDTLTTSYDNLLFNNYPLTESINTLFNPISIPVIVSESFMNTTKSWVATEYTKLPIDNTQYKFKVTEEVLNDVIFDSNERMWDNTFSKESLLTDVKLNLYVYPLTVTDTETVKEYDTWLKNLKFTLRHANFPNEQYLYSYFDPTTRYSFLKQSVVPFDKYFTIELNSDLSNYELDFSGSYFKFARQFENITYIGSLPTDIIPIFEYNSVGFYNLYINKEQLDFFGYNILESGHQGVIPTELKLNIKWSKSPTPNTSRYLYLSPNYIQLNKIDTAPWNSTDIENFYKFRKDLILTITGIDDINIKRSFHADENGNFDYLQLNNINLPFGKYQLDFAGSGINQYNKTFKVDYIWFYYIDNTGQEHSIDNNNIKEMNNGGRQFDIVENGRGYLFKFNIIWIDLIEETEFGIAPTPYYYNQTILYNALFDTTNPSSYWGGGPMDVRYKWWLNTKFTNMLKVKELNGVRESFSSAPGGSKRLFDDYETYDINEQSVKWDGCYNWYEMIRITTSIPYNSMTSTQQNKYNEWLKSAILKFEFEDSTTNQKYSISSYFYQETDYHGGNLMGGKLKITDLIKLNNPNINEYPSDWNRLPWEYKNFPNTSNIKPWYKIKFNMPLEDYNIFDWNIMFNASKGDAFVTTQFVGNAAIDNEITNLYFNKSDINNTKFGIATREFLDIPYNMPTSYIFNMNIEYIVK